MIPSTDLFKLIKSLGRKEKIYFSLYAGKLEGMENRGYMQLFEIILKQKEYDEESIKKK